MVGQALTNSQASENLEPREHNGGVQTRLTVELVPSTCWYTNVRSNVSRAVWDRLRRRVAADAGHRCEICGGRGRRWPVECHEVWAYDDATKVQRLERLVALCPTCHEAKHPGLASKRGRLDAVTGHLAAVNGWTPDDAALYLEVAFEQWAARSRHQWTLDISVLADHYGVDGADG
jgi:5-methylcytosine-specific restriction endonuclease McrA